MLGEHGYAVTTGVLVAALTMTLWSLPSKHWMVDAIEADDVGFQVKVGLFKACLSSTFGTVCVDLKETVDEYGSVLQLPKSLVDGAKVTAACMFLAFFLLLAGVATSAAAYFGPFPSLPPVLSPRAMAAASLASSLLASVFFAAALAKYNEDVIHSSEWKYIPSGIRPVPGFAYLLVILALILVLLAVVLLALTLFTGSRDGGGGAPPRGLLNGGQSSYSPSQPSPHYSSHPGNPPT